MPNPHSNRDLPPIPRRVCSGPFTECSAPAWEHEEHTEQVGDLSDDVLTPLAFEDMMLERFNGGMSRLCEFTSQPYPLSVPPTLTEPEPEP